MLRLCLLIVLGVVNFIASDTTFAQSASQSFPIQMQFGEDTEAPTIPTNLSATPVTATQIDLAWDAASDNLVVSGYQLFRDLQPIATTSQTNYADTGLTASTTYSYTVRAFDASGNYSTTSVAVATTTLPAPPPPPSSTPTTTPETADTSSGGVYKDVSLESFSIDATRSRAEFAWRTDRYTQYVLRWGRTSNYELGFVSTDVYVREHRTTVSDLEPGTEYAYELIAYDRRGAEYVLRRDTFTTQTAPDDQAPPNVFSVTAQAVGDDVRLQWRNPRVSDFAKVRVVRNSLFYPDDPLAGYVVYEGKAAQLIDRGVLSRGVGQYYTIFAYDQNGNVSSGAVVYVAPGSGQVAPPLPSSPDGATTTDRSPTTTPFQLSASDIAITQAGEGRNQGSQVVLDAAVPTTFRIPYERLPEHLKTVTVTLTREQDGTAFMFLLRINKDRTAYEATIAPLQQAGVYRFQVAVFDYARHTLTTTEGDLVVQASEPGLSLPLMTDASRIIWYSILVLLALWWIWLIALLIRRVRDRRDR